MEFLAFLIIAYWLGVFVSGFITLRRHQAVIRGRVEARGGRPIGDVEAWSRLAWCGLKGLLWPINLIAWLSLGRPEPGTYQRPELPVADIASPEERPGPRPTQAPPAPRPDPAPSGRHTVPDTSTPSSAPAFPSGPVVEPSAPAKAPHPPSGTKSPGPAAYVPSSSTPPPPSSVPSPVLPMPHAQFGAPQLAPDYALQVLRRAGFPATPHNVFAVQERLGIMFTTKARQFIEGLGSERDWITFVRRAGYPTADMHAWPQHVLNAVARWDRDSVPHIQDFYERYSAILLESGGFLGGSPQVPLATATDWHMKGIAQPSARPLPAP